eukprot:1629333-Pyramimonas_sp.AAC.1
MSLMLTERPTIFKCSLPMSVLSIRVWARGTFWYHAALAMLRSVMALFSGRDLEKRVSGSGGGNSHGCLQGPPARLGKVEDVRGNATLGDQLGLAEADAQVHDLVVADGALGVLEGSVVGDVDSFHERHEVAGQVDEAAVDRRLAFVSLGSARRRGGRNLDDVTEQVAPEDRLVLISLRRCGVRVDWRVNRSGRELRDVEVADDD